MPENDSTAVDDDTCPQKPPRRPVARCLFGKPDQDELANMEDQIYREDRQKMMDKYGVDINVLTQRDDIDILVVQVRSDSPEPEPEVNVSNLNLDTGKTKIKNILLSNKILAVKVLHKIV